MNRRDMQRSRRIVPAEAGRPATAVQAALREEERP